MPFVLKSSPSVFFRMDLHIEALGLTSLIVIWIISWHNFIRFPILFHWIVVHFLTFTCRSSGWQTIFCWPPWISAHYYGTGKDYIFALSSFLIDCLVLHYVNIFSLLCFKGEELRKLIGAPAYIECSSKTQQVRCVSSSFPRFFLALQGIIFIFQMLMVLVTL